MNKRGFLDISFGWLFAIIVGAFILFLAIYGVSKLIGTEETIQDAKTSKEIGILLNPLETGFESEKTSSFSLPAETRIYNKCSNYTDFGRQIISVSQKSMNKWTETNIDVGFTNKYIFSNKFVEGKLFYVFSKPLRLPFKVTDLIFITSSKDNYCFTNAPENIEVKIKNLNQKNLFVEDCPENSIEVCFGYGKDCNINVDYAGGVVKKSSGKMYFGEDDALMYAAIFSDKDVYECQLQRIMQRIGSLALLYRSKGNFISNKGCSSDSLNSNLMGLFNSVNNYESSANLRSIIIQTQDLEKMNENSRCRLW